MSDANTQPNNIENPYAAWLYSFWKFSRPHTIIGTSASVLGLYAIAIAFAGSVRVPLVLPFIVTWGACLSANIYIVGLNQLEDVEIDKINKPYLPIAAGEFSLRQGQGIVAIAGMFAIILAALGGPWLLATVGMSVLLGTAYSLPPVRLKRFPIWASFCIYTVRGVVVNLGLFLHSLWVLTEGSTQQPLKDLWIPPALWGLTLFILGYTFAIAIFKDIPDLEGDRQYNISTFTIRLGAKAVFNLARWVLGGCYVTMALVGWVWLPGVNRIVVAIAHLTALAILWWRSDRVDLDNQEAIAQYYQFIWKFFFLEYLIFPAACLLG